MKKIYLLLILITTTSCITSDQIVLPYDPSILTSIQSRLISNGTFSYIFLPALNRVFIQSSDPFNPIQNAWYALNDAETTDDGVASFFLDGWGNMDDQHLAVLVRTNDRGIQQVFVSVQNTRNFAISSVRSFSQDPTTQLFSVPQSLNSVSLYILSEIGNIVQTSLAGVFNPAETTYYQFVYGNQDALIEQGSVHISQINPTTGLLTTVTNALTFRSNINDTLTIYSFNDFVSGQIVVMGMRLDMLNPIPRMQFIFSPVTPGQDNAEVGRVAQLLAVNNRWNFSPESTILISDGSLTPFGGITWIIPDGTGNTFNPESTEQWMIDVDNSLATVTTTTPGTIKEDSYILNITPSASIFLLESLNDGGVYDGMFIHFKPIDATTGAIILGSSTTDVQSRLDSTGIPIRASTAITPRALVAGTVQSRATEWNTLADGTTQAGRMGFRAFLANDSIYAVGGYTNNFPLASGAPRVPVGSTILPPILNRVYRIDNIAGDISGLTFVDTGQDLDNTVTVNFQQTVGSVLPRTTPAGRDQLWILGASAIESQKFSINFLSPDRWNTTTIDAIPFTDRYHQEMTILGSQVLVAGGTHTASAIVDLNQTEIKGTYTNQVYTAPVDAQGTSASWNQVTEAAQWTPRVHPNIVTILSNYVLVGGMILNGGNQEGTNDTWISRDFGTNWTVQNAGGTTLASPTVAGAAPYQRGTDVANQGKLATTTYGGIIFVFDGETRGVFYSSDMGRTWYKSANGFESTAAANTPLYGAQIVAYSGFLYLLGGTSNITANLATDTGFNKQIHRISINF